MSKETRKPEDLVKTSKPGSIELSEQELQQVAGGKGNKTDKQDFLVVKMNDVLISG